MTQNATNQTDWKTIASKSPASDGYSSTPLVSKQHFPQPFSLGEWFGREAGIWESGDFFRGLSPEAKSAISAALFDPLREFLNRPSKSFRARLAELTWNILAPDRPIPEEISLIVELVHAGSLIVDDIQDDAKERRGGPALHRALGLPLALNLGNCLYFWPMILVERLKLAPSIENRVWREIAKIMLDCHKGQALDLSLRAEVVRPNECRDLVSLVTKWKTAGLTELSARLPAVILDSEPAVEAALAGFGEEFGIGIQQLNDFSDLRSACTSMDGGDDLRQSRLTWPWAWLADQVDTKSYIEFQRELADSNRSGASVQSLAQRIHAVVCKGPSPREGFTQRLISSVAKIRAALGTGVNLESFEQEIDRLRGSYV